MSDNAISIKNLSKVYRIYPDLTRSRIKQAIFPRRKFYSEKIALQDINLTLKKGEVVGVLGPNGAGKTTLLKILAGISPKTSGRVTINGRVVTVLALGLGFHPRLTGMENLQLAGMMLGMSRREIHSKRKWIAEFSELGEYFDRPLTSYSMGMKARLSFAIAACQEPEILIIDEALATGDIRFVQKCIHRIQEIVSSGTTALFVSHNIWSIKRLTKRSILLDRGRLVDDGETHKVADAYYEAMLNSDILGVRAAKLQSESKYVGSGEVQLRKLTIKNHSGSETYTLSSGEPAQVILEIASDIDRERVGIVLQCHRMDGIPAFANGAMAGGTMNEKGTFANAEFKVAKGISRIVVHYPQLLLAPGEFYFDLQLFDANDFSGFTTDNQFYFKSHVAEFTVQQFRNLNFFNLYFQPARIYVENSL